MSDNRTPSDLPLTEREVNGIRDSLRRYGASALDGVDAANLLATLDAARATVSAGPLAEWLLSEEACIPNDGLIIHASAPYLAQRIAARPVSAECTGDRFDSFGYAIPCPAHPTRLAARPVSAGDDRERLHKAVDIPLADDTLSANVRRSRVHAAIDGVSLSTGDDRLQEALEAERRRIADTLFAWAEKHHADPPLVVVVGTVDADGTQAADASERIRAALTSPATTEDPTPRRCIFEPCVATWEHYHGGFPGSYNDPADPTGVPITFTGPNPDPSAVRDDHGAALTEDPTP